MGPGSLENEPPLMLRVQTTYSGMMCGEVGLVVDIQPKSILRHRQKVGGSASFSDVQNRWSRLEMLTSSSGIRLVWGLGGLGIGGYAWW